MDEQPLPSQVKRHTVQAEDVGPVQQDVAKELVKPAAERRRWTQDGLDVNEVISPI